MLRRFFRNADGNVAMIFALAMIPVIVAAGGAIDYSRGEQLRTTVQDALDAATLAAARDIGKLNESQLHDKVVAYYLANIGKKIANPPTVTTKLVAATLASKATVESPNSFLGIIGISKFTYDVASEVTSGIGTLEIVMVLDNSGSMAGSKITALKNASTSLTNTLFNLSSTSTKTDPVKIGVVPFAASVNVGTQYANAAWIDKTGKGTYHAYEMKCYANGGTLNSTTGVCSVSVGTAINNFDLFKYLKDSSGNAIGWGGCVEERAPPYDVTDDSPSTAASPNAEQAKTLFVPMFAPDEPDNWTCGTGTCSYLGSSNSTRVYNGAPTGSQSYNNYLPDSGDATSCGALTVTVATPGVFTYANNGITSWATPVMFHTTGTLPTGLTAGTTYYAIPGSGATGSTTSNFRVSTMSAGNTFTVTVANPGVITKSSHGLSVGNPVTFTTTGALPTGLTAGTTYYVKTVPNANTFTVAATSGGTAIQTTGSQSGTHSYYTLVSTSGSQSGTHSFARNWTCQSGSVNCAATGIGKAETTAFAGLSVGSTAATGNLCKYGTGTSNKGTVTTMTVGGIPGGPNFMCTTPAITPLTTSKNTVLTAINNLVAQGATSISAGTGWGFRLLSPNLPFTEGRGYDDTENKKILIIETDGDNTYYPNSKFIKSWYDTYGYVARGQLGTTSTTSSTWTDYIDARTKLACDNAKAKGIIIYTVGYEINSSTVGNVNKALGLLQYCASDSTKYFNAQDSAALLEAFTAIGDSITSLRVSK